VLAGNLSLFILAKANSVFTFFIKWVKTHFNSLAFFIIPQAKAIWQFIFVNGVGTNDELTPDLYGGIIEKCDKIGFSHNN